MKRLWILMILTVIALGQSPDKPANSTVQKLQNCPVRASAWGREFRVKNFSAKNVKGAVFETVTVDAVGETHTYIAGEVSVFKVKAGSTHTVWGAGSNAARYKLTDTVYLAPKKILFEDGSTWEDDGTCRSIADLGDITIEKYKQKHGLQ